MKRRVVITGMGVVSPIGLDLNSFKESLRQGRSGEGPITVFESQNFPVKRVFEVKGFEPRNYGTHLLDPFIQYAIAAAAESIQHSGFEPQNRDPYRIGISMSSSKGGVHTIDRFKERFKKNRSAILGARIYSNAVPNFAAQWVARRWKIKGPAKCYIAACATGTVAVIEGARMVEEGIVDYCIAGASDASIVPLMLAGYHNMKALANGPFLPFDRRRNGFLVGEGAGAMLLESLESAEERHAKIYGEILGFHYGADAFDPVYFNPDDQTLALTLNHLLKRSGLTASDIDYINLHGTGTRAGDLYETNQLKKAFGSKAYQIPMSSTKSMTGHMLGATGAVEIIATLVAMNEGFIPPTIGLEEKDPACDLDYTPLKARDAKIERAISLSLGFGGHVAAIALGKAR